ncbi:unnamed protein product [Didymodactylos carnosus]|uniref:EF-hand domain-containing protein n=2 Tax=Didymodactylos carnosus TaxID=1234261 RepID=A0A816GS11_9BILA|nr:unnamed protein product [Didymodactylos carnosus]CAF4669440.1 unnamed protein product [Didymodactylos carnosus]
MQEINDSFREYDLNHNGYITFDEMKKCLRKANVMTPDEEVSRVLNQMDWNRDSQVSYDEYLKFMTSVYRGEQSELQRQLGSALLEVGSAAGSF